MNKIYFLIGASGAGKTTASTRLEQKRADIKFIYPDKEQYIPSQDEMIREYGSQENWQKLKTTERVKNIKEKYLSKEPVLVDTQSRFEFIKEACDQNDIEDYQVILFDCKDSIRNERLHGRGQPELINDQMNNWAKFLREDARKHNCLIIDTSDLSVDGMVDSLGKSLI